MKKETNKYIGVIKTVLIVGLLLYSLIATKIVRDKPKFDKVAYNNGMSHLMLAMPKILSKCNYLTRPDSLTILWECEIERQNDSLILARRKN